MIARLRRRLHSQRGLALPELLIATSAGLIVMLTLSRMLMVSLHQGALVGDRIDANQTGRLTMYQVMDKLHSACIAPLTVPIRAGSTDSSITFTYARGSAVQPTPTLLNIKLSGTDLVETTYASTGGTAPNWTFSSTPASTRTISTDIAATPGVPMFRYYGYSNGAIAATPYTATAASPLTAADALKTVQVVVAFDSAPLKTKTSDPNSAISLQDTAFLRLSPPGYDASALNAPCQ